MKKQNRTRWRVGVGLLGAFALWTAAIALIDVQAIGPQGACVGFAAVNQFVHNLTGVHMWLYTVTDWLGLVPIGIALGFGVLGLVQWIDRRAIGRVDFDLLALGVFYAAVFMAYALFEVWVVNERPILINGVLEASYPSSTTMLAMTVMPTAVLQAKRRIENRVLRRLVTAATMLFVLFMVVGRLISGVHWLTDIVGGVLLSTGLVLLYQAAIE